MGVEPGGPAYYTLRRCIDWLTKNLGPSSCVYRFATLMRRDSNPQDILAHEARGVGWIISLCRSSLLFTLNPLGRRTQTSIRDKWYDTLDRHCITIFPFELRLHDSGVGVEPTSTGFHTRVHDLGLIKPWLPASLSGVARYARRIRTTSAFLPPSSMVYQGSLLPRCLKRTDVFSTGSTSEDVSGASVCTTRELP